MDEMGFKNFDRVYEMARRGTFSKPNGDAITANATALNMMFYMASKSINKEDAKAAAQGIPYWVYFGGWNKMAADLGYTIAPIDLDDSSPEQTVETHSRTAVNRLSRTARFLQDQGAIKLLRPASTIGVKRNATWLLMLGENDQENQEAERQARRLLGLPVKPPTPIKGDS